MDKVSYKKEEKFLPIGSVVLINGALRPVMIIGYFFEDIKKETKDYLGVLYPEGYIDPSAITCFNHDDIIKVLLIGYEDKFFKKMNEKLIKVGESYEIN